MVLSREKPNTDSPVEPNLTFYVVPKEHDELTERQRLEQVVHDATLFRDWAKEILPYVALSTAYSPELEVYSLELLPRGGFSSERISDYQTKLESLGFSIVRKVSENAR